MIHNSFRRIALAQGLLPTPPYPSGCPGPDTWPDAILAVDEPPAYRPEPLKDNSTLDVIQV